MSSFVSASRVGATASGFCLERLGVETIILPTTLLGRHPGWGTPGGGPLPVEQLRAMWEGIKAQNLKIDAVMTGYMASVDHVLLAAEIITEVKASNPNALILVDPVMGDDGRLYIGKPTAAAIARELLPLAGICTPNLWELGYLSGREMTQIADVQNAARALPCTTLRTPLTCSTLVTSVPFGNDIGALLSQKGMPQIAVTHEKFGAVPHGGGDALAATFLAHRLNGLSPHESLAKATASIFKIISTAVADKDSEMPLIREQEALLTAAPLAIIELT